MKTILMQDDADYLVNLHVESLVDPNGSLIAPYYDDPKIEEIEKTLSEIGLIEKIQRKDSKGKVTGWFVKVNYIFKKERLRSLFLYL
jgi:hypothetical protein